MCRRPGGYQAAAAAPVFARAAQLNQELEYFNTGVPFETLGLQMGFFLVLTAMDLPIAAKGLKD